MKKLTTYMFLTALLFFSFCANCLAQNSFSKALETCEEYILNGTGNAGNDIYDISISLKPKGKVCVYKEKIYQGKDVRTLNCEFEKNQLGFISESMRRYNETYKREIAMNPIFEAKMTSNTEIFQKYLMNPSYCKMERNFNGK